VWIAVEWITIERWRARNAGVWIAVERITGVWIAVPWIAVERRRARDAGVWIGPRAVLRLYERWQGAERRQHHGLYEQREPHDASL
jgi:hypothetical protein